MCKCEHLRDHLVLPSILWKRTDHQRVRDLLHVAPLRQGWDPSFLPPGTHVWMCVSPGINFGVGGDTGIVAYLKWGRDCWLACYFSSSLSFMEQT